MKTALACLLLLACCLVTVGQTKRSTQLHRANPDGWFTILVPAWAREAKRHADVDGGFFYSKNIDISWDYWPYEGTPNFLRKRNGSFSRSATMACPRRTSRRIIQSGHRAVEQFCERVIPGTGRRNIVYIGLDHILIRTVDEFHTGIFNLQVEFKKKRDELTAERIIRSLRFIQTQ